MALPLLSSLEAVRFRGRGSKVLAARPQANKTRTKRSQVRFAKEASVKKSELFSDSSGFLTHGGKLLSLFVLETRAVPPGVRSNNTKRGNAGAHAFLFLPAGYRHA